MTWARPRGTRPAGTSASTGWSATWTAPRRQPGGIAGARYTRSTPNGSGPAPRPSARRPDGRSTSAARPRRLGGPRHRRYRGQETMQPVAVVTGASIGIGAATAASLAGAGYHVVLAARRADRLDEVAAKISSQGGSAQPIVLDVTDR